MTRSDIAKEISEDLLSNSVLDENNFPMIPMLSSGMFRILFECVK